MMKYFILVNRLFVPLLLCSSLVGRTLPEPLLPDLNAEDSIRLILEVETDNQPEQSYWQLLDEQENIILEVFPGFYTTSDSIHFDTLPIPKGCYTFLFIDTEGNGICCEEGRGSFRLTEEDGTYITGQSSGFEDLHWRTFCLESSPDYPPMYLEIQTDSYPRQIKWEFFDQAGNLIAQRDTGQYTQPFTTYLDTVYLPEQCMDFVMLDAGQDGICCDQGIGSYALRDASGTLLALGGDFGASSVHTLCRDSLERERIQFAFKWETVNAELFQMNWRFVGLDNGKHYGGSFDGPYFEGTREVLLPEGCYLLEYNASPNSCDFCGAYGDYSLVDQEGKTLAEGGIFQYEFHPKPFCIGDTLSVPSFQELCQLALTLPNESIRSDSLKPLLHSIRLPSGEEDLNLSIGDLFAFELTDSSRVTIDLKGDVFLLQMLNACSRDSIAPFIEYSSYFDENGACKKLVSDLPAGKYYLLLENTFDLDPTPYTLNFSWQTLPLADSCEQATPLIEGVPFINDTPSVTRTFNQYRYANGTELEGRFFDEDYAFYFNVQDTSWVSIQLTDLNENKNLILLEGCNPHAVVSSSTAGSLSGESIFLKLPPGTYFPIVENPERPFHLDSFSIQYDIILEEDVCSSPALTDNAEPLTFGELYISTTTSAPRTQDEYQYKDSLITGLQFGEKVYVFTLEEQQELFVRSASKFDHDLFITRAENACQAIFYHHISGGGSWDSYFTTLVLEAGDYLVIVDGQDPAEDAFTLQIGCPDLDALSSTLLPVGQVVKDSTLLRDKTLFFTTEGTAIQQVYKLDLHGTTDLPYSFSALNFQTDALITTADACAVEKPLLTDNEMIFFEYPYENITVDRLEQVSGEHYLLVGKGVFDQDVAVPFQIQLGCGGLEASTAIPIQAGLTPGSTENASNLAQLYYYGDQAEATAELSNYAIRLNVDQRKGHIENTGPEQLYSFTLDSLKEVIIDKLDDDHNLYLLAEQNECSLIARRDFRPIRRILPAGTYFIAVEKEEQGAQDSFLIELQINDLQENPACVFDAVSINEVSDVFLDSVFSFSDTLPIPLGFERPKCLMETFPAEEPIYGRAYQIFSPNDTVRLNGLEIDLYAFLCYCTGGTCTYTCLGRLENEEVLNIPNETVYLLALTRYPGFQYQLLLDPDCGPNPPEALLSELEVTLPCNGASVELSALASFGDSLRFSWFQNPDSILQTGATLAVAQPGQYTVRVQSDRIRCFDFATADVSLAKLEGIVLDSAAFFCYPDESWRISLAGMGGFGPLSYDWSDGFMGMDRSGPISPLLYSVTIRDTSGCEGLLEIDLTGNPDELTLDFEFQDIPGEPLLTDLLVNIQGGTPPYTIEVEGMDSVRQRTTNLSSITFENLFSGDYMLSVSDTFGCTGKTELVTRTKEPSWANDLRVFPNPTTGLLRVGPAGLSTGSKLFIRVQNQMGQHLLQKVYTFAGQGTLQLDLSSFPSGWYTISLHTEEGLAVRSVLVER